MCRMRFNYSYSIFLYNDMTIRENSAYEITSFSSNKPINASNDVRYGSSVTSSVNTLQIFVRLLSTNRFSYCCCCYYFSEPIPPLAGADPSTDSEEPFPLLFSIFSLELVPLSLPPPFFAFKSWDCPIYEGRFTSNGGGRSSRISCCWFSFDYPFSNIWSLPALLMLLLLLF